MMNGNKFASIAIVALMASAMAFAQSGSQGTNSQGTMDSQSGSSTATSPQMGGHTDSEADLPAAKEGESQSGKDSQADPSSKQPGSIGSPETPNQGTSPEGTTPATGGAQSGRGSSNNDDSLPGVEPPSNNGTDANAPKKFN